MFRRSLRVVSFNRVASVRSFARKSSFDADKLFEKVEKVKNNKWFGRLIKYGPSAVKYVPIVITNGPKVLLGVVVCSIVGYLWYLKRHYEKRYAEFKSGIYGSFNNTKDKITGTFASIKDGFSGVEEKVADVGSGIKDSVSSVKEKVSDQISSTKDTIQDRTSNTTTQVKERLSNTFSKFKDKKDALFDKKSDKNIDSSVVNNSSTASDTNNSVIDSNEHERSAKSNALIKMKSLFSRKLSKTTTTDTATTVAASITADINDTSEQELNELLDIFTTNNDNSTASSSVSNSSSGSGSGSGSA